MFIDDEKSPRHRRGREGRAVFYITVTALAACVLMVIGLLNVAQAGPIDAARMVLSGEIGETRLVLDTAVLNPAIDPITTASTERNGETASVDQRLMTALGLAGFIVVAGFTQMMGRNTGTRSSPAARWRSEA